MSHSVKTLPMKSPLTVQLPPGNMSVSVAPLLMKFPLLCPKKARQLLDELEGDLDMAMGIVEEQMGSMEEERKKIDKSEGTSANHNTHINQPHIHANGSHHTHPNHPNQQAPLKLEHVKKCFLRLYRKYLGKAEECEQMKTKLEQLERENSMIKLRNRQLIQLNLKQANEQQEDRRIL